MEEFIRKTDQERAQEEQEEIEREHRKWVSDILKQQEEKKAKEQERRLEQNSKNLKPRQEKRKTTKK
jgi:hypothetical protein